MSEAELLTELKKLQGMEGSSEEQRLLKKKSRLYRLLLEENPDAFDYKLGLAETLMRLGTDEKLIYMNFSEAKAIFLKILELDKNHAEALYRLGHVYLELHHWEQAMDMFHCALELEIPRIKKVRAFCGLAEAAFRLNQINQAMGFLNEARHYDVDRDCSMDLNRIEAMMTHPDNEFLVTKEGKSFFVSEEEAYDFENEEDNEIKLILDLTFSQAELIDHKSRASAPLEPKQVQLLRYLHENKGHYLTKDHLHNQLWAEETKLDPEILSNRIKNVVSELRQVLQALNLEIPANKLIVTGRGTGYSWQGPYKLEVLERNPFFL